MVYPSRVKYSPNKRCHATLNCVVNRGPEADDGKLQKEEKRKDNQEAGQKHHDGLLGPANGD